MSLVFRLIQNNSNRHVLFAATRRCEMYNIIRSAGQTTCSSTGTGGEGHDERNMRMGRIMSPHLSIYKPQLTAMLSISHRATGMILSSYIMLFAMLPWVLPEPLGDYLDSFECDYNIGSLAVLLVKGMLAFPLCYHYWNGIRHLIWDTNNLQEINNVYMTGYLMLLVAAASTGILLFLF